MEPFTKGKFNSCVFALYRDIDSTPHMYETHSIIGNMRNVYESALNTHTFPYFKGCLFGMNGILYVINTNVASCLIYLIQ